MVPAVACKRERNGQRRIEKLGFGSSIKFRVSDDNIYWNYSTYPDRDEVRLWPVGKGRAVPFETGVRLVVRDFQLALVFRF